jgi:chromosome partitioning protein
LLGVGPDRAYALAQRTHLIQFWVEFLALSQGLSQIMLACSGTRPAALVGRDRRDRPGGGRELMTVVLAIANQNRGVGKTVTAANVSAGFAHAGRRTLAVDGDAQADLTRWLLGRSDEDAADLEAIVVGGADPATAVRPTRVAGLDALPATPRLAHIARALAADNTLVARALGRLRPGYDAIVLDLSSSLSRLTVSALATADGIVVPVTASVLGLHGLAGFRDWLASFRADGVITAPVWGVLLTQADLDAQGRLRTRVGREVREALADFRVTGARLLPVLVPRRAGVEDLVSQRLLLGDPAARAGPGRDVVDAYARLVEYLLERVPAAAGPPAAGTAR